jgi:hypothetical protein
MTRKLLSALVLVVILGLNDGVAAAAGTSVRAVIQVADQLRVNATNISTPEGAAIQGPIATFSDSNPVAPASAFAATVRWGDRSTSSGVVAGTDGSFSVTASHVYIEEGSYRVTVLIVETQAGQAASSGTARISDAPLSARGRNISGSRRLNAVLAAFSDADPRGTITDYAAVISWGDGSTSVGTIAAANGGAFLVRGVHRYRSAGRFTAQILIRDAGGARTTVATHVVVVGPY